MQLGGVKVTTNGYTTLNDGLMMFSAELLNPSNGCSNISLTANYTIVITSSTDSGLDSDQVELRAAETLATSGTRTLPDVVADYISNISTVNNVIEKRVNKVSGLTEASFRPGRSCLPWSVNVMHWNDIHGRVTPSDSNFQPCAETGASNQYGMFSCFENILLVHHSFFSVGMAMLRSRNDIATVLHPKSPN